MKNVKIMYIKRPQEEVFFTIFEKVIAEKVQISKHFLNYK